MSIGRQGAPSRNVERSGSRPRAIASNRAAASIGSTFVAKPRLQSAGRSARQRNRRGEGAHLRDEIITGATKLLERTGSEESVTLRAIAREVGIAAPSISLHFKDLPEIIDAVVAREAAILLERLTAAARSTEAPGPRLRTMCRTYVDFGRERPARYRLLVGRRFLDVWETEDRAMDQSGPLLREAVGLVAWAVQECIDAGASSGTDALVDTAVLWFTLHGLITVPQAITSVPWPDGELLLQECTTRAAQLHPPGALAGQAAAQQAPRRGR